MPCVLLTTAGSASGAGPGEVCTLCCRGAWGHSLRTAVGSGRVQSGTSLQWPWELLVVCSGLREEQTFPCQMCCWPCSQRGMPQRSAGDAWLGAFTQEFVFQTCTAPWSCHCGSTATQLFPSETGHRPFRSWGFAALTVSAEVCLEEAGSDMGVSVGGRFSAGQSPQFRGGVAVPPVPGHSGSTGGAPQARLSLVSRAASAFQRSLLEGDHEADGVSASPSRGSVPEALAARS